MVIETPKTDNFITNMMATYWSYVLKAVVENVSRET